MNKLSPRDYEDLRFEIYCTILSNISLASSRRFGPVLLLLPPWPVRAPSRCFATILRFVASLARSRACIRGLPSAAPISSVRPQFQGTLGGLGRGLGLDSRAFACPPLPPGDVGLGEHCLWRRGVRMQLCGQFAGAKMVQASAKHKPDIWWLVM